MNRMGGQEQLLNDVLAEGMTENLHEDLFAETLRQVRRRRHARHVRRAVGTLALVVGLGFILWPRPQRTLVRPSPVKPYALVLTQPLAKADIIETLSLNQASLVTSRHSATTISTATTLPLLHEIGDADLLSLAAPSPVVLVRLGPHSAQLVFVPTTEADAVEHQTEQQ